MLIKNKKVNKFFINHPWIPSIMKITGILCFVLVFLLVLISQTLKLAGIDMMYVVSNSMVPVFSKGDLILVSHKANTFNIGDVIVYHQGDPYNRDVVHRVINIMGNNIQVKGDANSAADPIFNRSQVKGEVVGILYNVGFLFKTFTICMLIFIGGLLDFITASYPIVFTKKHYGKHFNGTYTTGDEDAEKKKNDTISNIKKEQ